MIPYLISRKSSSGWLVLPEEEVGQLHIIIMTARSSRFTIIPNHHTAAKMSKRKMTVQKKETKQQSTIRLGPSVVNFFIIADDDVFARPDQLLPC
jgi:hypothetical protein